MLYSGYCCRFGRVHVGLSRVCVEGDGGLCIVYKLIHLYLVERHKKDVISVQWA